MTQKNYRRTKTACYFGFITQAISANFTPLLFLTFYRAYGISYADLALIPLVFFLTQLVVDFLSANGIRKISFSKYGAAYRQLMAADNVMGGRRYA